MTDQIDTRDLRTAFGKFATGITVITTRLGPSFFGMTANSFTSVSMDPPMLLVCVANKARALPAILEAKTFGISVLAEDQKSVSNHFAGRKEFDEVGFESFGGVPTIKGSIAKFSCSLADAHEAGDHMILVGLISDYAYDDGSPLIYNAGNYCTLSE